VKRLRKDAIGVRVILRPALELACREVGLRQIFITESGSVTDCPAHPVTGKQRPARGVEDGVNVQCGDVGANGAKGSGHC
jgi:hypothetical protein